MAPEQARGRQADRRADVWAFGVVVYEMLTGRQAFAGETISDTLASVMRDEPDWSALPPALSPRWRRLLERCLAKDPRQRLQAIGEARIALEDLAANPAEGASLEGSASAAKRVRPTRLLPWLVAALAVLALAVCAVAKATGASFRRHRAERRAVRGPEDRIGPLLSPAGDLARRPCARLHGPSGRPASAEAAAARYARGRRALRRRGSAQPLLFAATASGSGSSTAARCPRSRCAAAPPSSSPMR